MANNYFQFKQFTVHQEDCAMKVTTDACLFGAICADSLTLKVENILDIGAGTGLLSLMIAQKNSDCLIDAVEIDEQAATQAASNFKTSSWKERLQIHHHSVQQFQSEKKYDFIVSNPPFFNNDLKSDDSKRNIALHSTELSLEELLAAIKINLSEQGSFAVLLPYHRSDYFISLCLNENFYLSEIIKVKQTPAHNYFRSILFFNRKENNIKEKEIIIQHNNEYTIDFIELLKDYYLYL